MFRKYPILLLLVPLVVLILFADRWHWDDFSGMPKTLDEGKRQYVAVVQDYAKQCPKTWRVEAEVMPERTHAYLYLQSDSTRTLPTLGDTILIMAQFKQGGQLGDFDYGRYLLRNGIGGTAYVGKKDWKITGYAMTTPLPLLPQKVQHKAYERYKQMGISGQELATTAALTLGYKDDLDQELKGSFQKAGAAHIFAVSGLHTGIIYSILFFLFTCFGLYPPLYEARNHQRVVSGLIIIALIGYSLLTGGTPSVVRSVIFVSMVELAKIWHRQPFLMNTLLVTAFVILFFRPLDLFSVSFQLSFAAVAGIILLEPKIRSLFPLPLKTDTIGFKTVNYFRTLLTISLAAQIFTLPLSLYYFSQTSNLFFVTNMIVIPLAFLLMVCALLLLILGWVPIAGEVLATLTSKTAELMNHSVGWVEQLPHAVTYAQMSLPAMVALYMIIFLFVILIRIVL